MLIGLDAIPLTEPLTGVGRYTLELARALARAAPADEFELLYPTRYAPISLAHDEETLPANLRLARVRAGLFGRRWWLVGLPRHVARRGYALFHGTNYETPLRAACPTVLTIHDLSVFAHPETHVARRASRLRRRLPLMACAATQIITPTEAVRREACDLLKLDPSKVTAIHEAPRASFRPMAREQAAEALRRFNIAGDFLLAVGTIEPRKNLLTLIAAFEQSTRVLDGKPDGSSHDETSRGDGSRAGSSNSRAGSTPLELVVAGREGWLSESLRARVASSPVGERIHFTGYVSDEELRALYSSCLAFVYPSFYEGFGLPPLEAAACGAPVVASRTPAHLETLGADAALLFAPADADALARAILDLAADETLRRRIADAGLRRASEFTWARAAERTREVYERALRAGLE